MNPGRTEALLEAVRAVQDSVSRLEREIMSAMAEDGRRTPPPPDSSDTTAEWFTLAELGEWLKVSRTTAHGLVSSRELPSYRVGRAIRVRRADVERWLEENRWEVGG
jgi:excisionase family DNA binding protein